MKRGDVSYSIDLHIPSVLLTILCWTAREIKVRHGYTTPWPIRSTSPGVNAKRNKNVFIDASYQHGAFSSISRHIRGCVVHNGTQIYEVNVSIGFPISIVRRGPPSNSSPSLIRAFIAHWNDFRRCKSSRNSFCNIHESRELANGIGQMSRPSSKRLFIPTCSKTHFYWHFRYRAKIIFETDHFFAKSLYKINPNWVDVLHLPQT